jgi:hypothetical protein
MTKTGTRFGKVNKAGAGEASGQSQSSNVHVWSSKFMKCHKKSLNITYQDVAAMVLLFSENTKLVPWFMQLV